MRHSILDENGVVMNTIEIDNPSDLTLKPGYSWAATEGNIGETWNGIKYLPAPAAPVADVDPFDLEPRNFNLNKEQFDLFRELSDYGEVFGQIISKERQSDKVKAYGLKSRYLTRRNMGFQEMMDMMLDNNLGSGQPSNVDVSEETLSVIWLSLKDYSSRDTK
jgi:hypothetical protein